jgi:L-rhamnose mutarotase
MQTEHPAQPETFTFTTLLRAGRETDYERFHRAIPVELDAAMRAAGVLGWQIRRRGTTLTHTVTAESRARMNLTLEDDPVNRGWQREVAPFLATGRSAPPPDADPGALVWDLAWPNR